MGRREQLLDGRLEVSEQIVRLVGKQYRATLVRMMKSLWTNCIKNGGSTSSVYWLEQFGSEKILNRALKHLSRTNWIVSDVVPGRNWAELYINEAKILEYIDADEFRSVREFNKFNHYKMDDTYSLESDRTKTRSGVSDTGISRPGTASLANSMFTYDGSMIAKYQDLIELNVTKSMRELDLDTDGLDYEHVSKQIVEYHMYTDKQFCMGGLTNDARGRAIPSFLRSVLNPIGYKDARALVVIPVEHRTTLRYGSLKHVYLAIAELLGSRPRTMFDKIAFGRSSYENKQLLDLDYSTDEGRADMYENIWLERLYAELDLHFSNKSHKWSVPIEKDHTASMLQIEGALLDHRPFLEGTNVIGDTLGDIWTKPGIRRLQLKKAVTPMLYGSSKSPAELWNALGMKYTKKQLSMVNKEVSSGTFGVANLFKEFIIDNVEPQENMVVDIWGEKFTIECNRYTSVGECCKQYNVYDSKTDGILTIHHTSTKRVADLEQFRRYFVTLLCHNLDSQMMDYTAAGLAWGIPILDAYVLCPSEADTACTRSGKMLSGIHSNRVEILENYFKSVGISTTNNKQWSKLMKAVEPTNIDKLVVSQMSLK